MRSIDHIGSAFLRRILRRMRELGVNQSELAKRMKVSKPYITKVLRQDVNFSFRTAAKLAQALEMDFLPDLREKKILSIALILLALAGCALIRPNPLEARRGAVVMVFDTREARDVRALRMMLATNDVRATVFAAGQVGRRTALHFKDLQSDGSEIGLSGMRGLNPQLYVSINGPQKYYQDEILSQFMGAERQGLNPRHYLLRYPTKMKAEVLKLPPYLVSKGFARVVDLMPAHIQPRAEPASRLAAPVVHAYRMGPNNFSRAQIESLAKRNEVLVVMPDREVLPALLAEAKAQGVPFATLKDLGEL